MDNRSLSPPPEPRLLERDKWLLDDVAAPAKVLAKHGKSDADAPHYDTVGWRGSLTGKCASLVGFWPSDSVADGISSREEAKWSHVG